MFAFPNKLPVTLPVTFPVTFPVRSPVTFPVTFPDTFPVRSPVTFPVKPAVITPALKLPDPSLFTIVLGVFDDVAALASTSAV